ncbi:MAG: DUF3667 domain-containing protein [Ferruginibacter sp.]
MSHFKERKEKNCLNCNAGIHGKYCHVCGQENIEPKETAWHLVTHFFNDITHFDGKFFSTLKYLITRPGFVSKEYMIGRRASYLNPVRMYVFTSAIFFLIFFSVTHFDESKVETTIKGKKLSEITKMDSAAFSEFTKKLNDGKPFSRDQFLKYADTSRKKGTFSIAPGKYRDKAQYDSLLKAGVKKHNWLERTLVYKQLELNEKYQNDGNKILVSFFNALLHSFPQMLFISLPLFALFLKLLYIRRKNFYYTNHVIFGVHLYVFVFILLLLLIGLGQARNYLGWNWINFIITIGALYILFYEYKAMRKFYLQGRGKTILKFFLLNILMLILLSVLFIVFSFFSLLKI